MTATRLSQKLLSKTCNLSFPQRGTGVSKENTTNTFIACGTWLKTPFYTSSAGVELPLGTQRIPHPLSLLFKSGAYLCGQMCLHKLVSTLSNEYRDDILSNVVFLAGGQIQTRYTLKQIRRQHVYHSIVRRKHISKGAVFPNSISDGCDSVDKLVFVL